MRGAVVAAVAASLAGSGAAPLLSERADPFVGRRLDITQCPLKEYETRCAKYIASCFTLAPTLMPTVAPTNPLPTDAPTDAPTTTPTAAAPAATPVAGGPTATPTADPTTPPTAAPTNAPTSVPTGAPTRVPTGAPTAAPTATPNFGSASPTVAPTATPVAAPTSAPTPDAPTHAPTAAPTDPPTTATPTAAPTGTAIPTATPTDAPTDCACDCNDWLCQPGTVRLHQVESKYELDASKVYSVTEASTLGEALAARQTVLTRGIVTLESSLLSTGSQPTITTVLNVPDDLAGNIAVHDINELGGEEYGWTEYPPLIQAGIQDDVVASTVYKRILVEDVGVGAESLSTTDLIAISSGAAVGAVLVCWIIVCIVCATATRKRSKDRHRAQVMDRSRPDPASYTESFDERRGLAQQ